MPRTREELSKLTVVDLKAELKALGKSVLGKKDELVERLLAAESGTDGAADPAQPADPAAAAAAPAAEEAAKAPASAGAEDATAGNGAAALEDGGTSKGTAEAKRAKIEFTEKVIKAMPAKVTVVKPTTSEPLQPTKSETQKLRERADRFKDPEVEKAKQRAERFGVYNEDLEREKAKKRAERFGTYNADLDEERKQKRAERFGIEDPEARLKARAERFKGTAAPLPAATKPAAGGGGAKGSSEFEQLKQARAARFGLKA